MSSSDIAALKRAIPSKKPDKMPAPSAHQRPACPLDPQSTLRHTQTHSNSSLISIPVRTKRVIKLQPPKALISKTKLGFLTTAITKGLELAQIGPPRLYTSEKRVFSAQPKPKTAKLLAFEPNVDEAKALIANFGNTVFTYEPNDEGANYSPWSQLAPASYGAVSRSRTRDTALLRLRSTSAAANDRLDELCGTEMRIVLEAGVHQDDVVEWIVAELVALHERYFNRRMALLKELEIMKAKDVVGRVEEL